MVTDIDALNERLKDPEGIFTSAEAQALVDWHVNRAHADEYQKSRIADMMMHNAEVAAHANEAMDKLLDLWDPSPMAPTLEVATGE